MRCEVMVNWVSGVPLTLHIFIWKLLLWYLLLPFLDWKHPTKIEPGVRVPNLTHTQDWGLPNPTVQGLFKPPRTSRIKQCHWRCFFLLCLQSYCSRGDNASCILCNNSSPGAHMKLNHPSFWMDSTHSCSMGLVLPHHWVWVRLAQPWVAYEDFRFISSSDGQRFHSLNRSVSSSWGSGWCNVTTWGCSQQSLNTIPWAQPENIRL